MGLMPLTVMNWCRSESCRWTCLIQNDWARRLKGAIAYGHDNPRLTRSAFSTRATLDRDCDVLASSVARPRIH